MGKIVQDRGDGWMIGPSHLLEDEDRASIERLCFSVSVQGCKDDCQTGEAVCNIGVVGAEYILVDGKSPLVSGLRVAIPTLCNVDRCKCIQHRADSAMVGAQSHL
jgi:hypothetical protein